jgi:hypothetical protein
MLLPIPNAAAAAAAESASLTPSLYADVEVDVSIK